MTEEVSRSREDLEVAIIGMAGRFPGASDVSLFWQNLRDGVESIRLFSDEEMKKLGVPPSSLRDPNFIKAGAMLEDADLFDAEFFGYSPREAEMLDPQQRVFLECAWTALEDAGYNPEACSSLIGVFAGTSMSSYLLFNLLGNSLSPQETFEAMISNDKDFLSTRVSYDLNLKGPSIDVQTACSTSLVAIHLACQSLLAYQCDIALAGGVSIQVPQRAGYYYEEGGINSSDGHCRAFDAKADGVIFGSGAGVVVLKRLSDALADNDSSHAVIKGSAVNNDGSSKLGYVAPSVEGQAQVVSLAHLVAGVSPETINYIEAHGTATALGDPVEMAALSRAFRLSTGEKGFCAIGSVKTNIGHLDAAAGVAGLIKTALALKHRMIPPSLHFESPNPRIDFDGSPFYVNSRLTEWKQTATPRRAGISSFGIGGTNAHLVIEEAPPAEPSGESRSSHLLLLSARNEASLDAAAANLAAYLKDRNDLNAADVAYTLQIGRKSFKHRRALVFETVAEAAGLLDSGLAQLVLHRVADGGRPSLAFMFPGGGAQHVNMGLDLYREEPVFREQIDECSRILLGDLGYDLRDRLYPEAGDFEAASEHIKRTSVGLPALFSVEYAMARLLLCWGLEPEAFIGHSLGEYVAACLSGVFSLEDALSLVVVRSKLFEELPKGGMLSVPLPGETASGLLDNALSIAAINAPSQCVLSGTVEEIDRAAAILGDQQVEFRRLQIEVAAHSEMVSSILDAFEASIRRLPLGSPRIPFVSNVTGTWITEQQATDPLYWKQHLKQTVLFSSGLAELLQDENRVLIDVGPGQTLFNLAKLQCGITKSQSVVSMMRHPYERGSDMAVLLTGLGRLWLSGAEIDWEAFYAREQRSRLSLPTYVFDRRRFWIEPATSATRPSGGPRKKPDIDDWFYTHSWTRSVAMPRPSRAQPSTWVIFAGEQGLGVEMGTALRDRGDRVITATLGERFQRSEGDHFVVRAHAQDDYDTVIGHARSDGPPLGGVVHLWSGAEPAPSCPESFDRESMRGFHSLLAIARALDAAGMRDSIRLLVISNRLEYVESSDRICPEKSPILGACRAIPQEFENIDVKVVDAGEAGDNQQPNRRLIKRLLSELDSGGNGEVIAYRGENRWVLGFERVELDAHAGGPGIVRSGGVCLITGGLGGIGLLLANYLARERSAKVVLAQRSFFPPKPEWDLWLSRAGEQNEISRKIRKLRSIEQSGGDVLVFSADVADREQMKAAIDETRSHFGDIDVVIHLAGTAGEKAVRLISQLTKDDCESQFEAKTRGLYVLEEVFRSCPPRLFILFSSNAAVLGGLGLAAYAAANLFMDAFSISRNSQEGPRWLSANWDGWLLDESGRLNTAFQTTMDEYAMTPAESVEAFERVGGTEITNRPIVSTGDLDYRHDLWVRRKGRVDNPSGASGLAGKLHPRPSLGTALVPPQDEAHRKIASIWQDLLGVEQVGIHDNFFELGGNSLISLKLISRLKAEFNVEVPVVAVFESPTVSLLAESLRGGADQNAARDESRSRGERRREKRRRRSSAEAG
jgi:acyl transferase domain-containing protein/acyl carrier protein